MNNNHTNNNNNNDPALQSGVETTHRNLPPYSAITETTCLPVGSEDGVPRDGTAGGNGCEGIGGGKEKNSEASSVEFEPAPIYRVETEDGKELESKTGDNRSR